MARVSVRNLATVTSMVLQLTLHSMSSHITATTDEDPNNLIRLNTDKKNDDNWLDVIKKTNSEFHHVLEIAKIDLDCAFSNIEMKTDLEICATLWKKVKETPDEHYPMGILLRQVLLDAVTEDNCQLLSAKVEEIKQGLSAELQRFSFKQYLDPINAVCHIIRKLNKGVQKELDHQFKCGLSTSKNLQAQAPTSSTLRNRVTKGAHQRHTSE